MITSYLKWAKCPDQTFSAYAAELQQNHKPNCAICANPFLAGGAWIGLQSGLVLGLCVACGRRVRFLTPIERADVVAELAARYAPDWRLAA